MWLLTHSSVKNACLQFFAELQETGGLIHGLCDNSKWCVSSVFQAYCLLRGLGDRSSDKSSFSVFQLPVCSFHAHTLIILSISFIAVIGKGGIQVKDTKHFA